MDPNFWSGIEDLGLGDTPVATQRSARCSAPGGFSSVIPTIPPSHPSVAKPPALLTAQQQHVYANSSPASPAGPDGSCRKQQLAGRMSSPGQYPPPPAPGEQDYKELYDSLELEEAEAAAAAEAEAELYNDEVYADVREGASLQVSPMKKRLATSMRRPLVLSMNTRMNKDSQLQKEQLKHAASTFTSFRITEHDLSTTSRTASSSVGEPGGAPLAHTPAHAASRLSSMHMGAPPLPPKTPLPTKQQQPNPKPAAQRVSDIDIDRIDINSIDKVMQWVSAGVADFSQVKSPRTSSLGNGEAAEGMPQPPSSGALPGTLRAVSRPASGQRSVKHTGVFL